MKKILILICLFATNLCNAQVNSITVRSQIASDLPDNTTRQITALKHRSVLNKIVDLVDTKLVNVSSQAQLIAATTSNFANYDGATWQKMAGNVASNGDDIINVSSTVYWKRVSLNTIKTKELTNQKLHTVSSKTALIAFSDSDIAQFDGSTWEKKSGNVASNGGAFAGTLIRVSSTTYWQRIENESVNVIWFGASPTIPDNSIPIQNAINYASENSKRGSVYIPAGSYQILSTLEIPNFITIFGDANSGTIINNQNVSIPVQLKNKETDSFIYVTLKNLIFRGGVIGMDINVTGEVAGCKFDNVLFELHTDYNLKVNKLLQTCNFNSCTFADANFGVYCSAFTANLNNFNNCNFLSNKIESVHFVYSEVNNFIGCRFEAAGTATGITLNFFQPNNTLFKGCYFEATHKKLIQEVNSQNNTNFEDCHFTGYYNGSVFEEYTFISDGILNFKNNSFSQLTKGGDNMQITGFDKKLGNNQTNEYVTYSQKNKHIISKTFQQPTGTDLNILSFTKVAVNGSLQNLQMISGIITLQYLTILNGGFEINTVRKYKIKCSSVGISDIAYSITLIDSEDILLSRTISLVEVSNPTPTALNLKLVFGGVVASDCISSSIKISFNGENLITNNTESFDVKTL